MRKTPLLIVAGIAAAAVAVYHYTVHGKPAKGPGGLFNTPYFGAIGKSVPAPTAAAGLFGTPVFGGDFSA